ncbi:hypothetical protein BRADI_4g12818v3 [Brachypodium distachyon]|uniref:SANT domain-containing protein n=1 Tax=Brachypodium distachyon TaxID=15368 RepID=A0A2K2CME7_BRADI|nr:hypothetical protein BRADI_4g12818v3 [Brachypodium distachyon]
MYPERLGSKVEHDEKCGKSSKSAGQNIHCSSVRKANDYVPVPGMPMYSWTGEEAQTFLLGLYIFGKNLVQVTKFMKSKTLVEVLSYYYGDFFRSDGYDRWAACRDVRSRCILGSRIFSGPRQQELLSRLLAAVAREARDALLEILVEDMVCQPGQSRMAGMQISRLQTGAEDLSRNHHEDQPTSWPRSLLRASETALVFLIQPLSLMNGA